MLEEPRALGPFHDGPVLRLGDARGDEVLWRARLVDGGDGAEARAGQRLRALDDLAEHRLKVEARADPEARRAERRDAIAQRLVFFPQSVVALQRHSPLVLGATSNSARHGANSV